MNQARRHFIVLTTGRSGSTWVMDTLNRLNGVTAYGELFLPQNSDGRGILSTDFPRYIERGSLTRRLPRPISTFVYLNRLLDQPQCVGFKLMYTQLRRFPEILPYILLRRIRVIHLIRRNYLDIVISQTRAQVSGKSHIRLNEVESGPVKFSVDTKALRWQLDRLRTSRKRVAWMLRYLPIPTLEIAYEDLSTGRDAWGPVLVFLGLDGDTEIPQSGLDKRAKLPRSELITNFAEVQEALEGTDFEQFLSR